MQKLTRDLFDRFGRLERRFVNKEGSRGSGAWGKELDHGDILFVEMVWSHPAWRSKGIATKLLASVIREARVKVDPSFRMWTLVNINHDWVTGDISTEAAQSDVGGGADVNDVDSDDDCYSMTLNFFHRLGFRFVGNSHWVAYSDWPNHPSRKLAPEDDYVKPSPPAKLTPDWAKLFAKLKIRENPVDEEGLLKELEQVESHSGGYMAQAKEATRAKDQKGNTILHVAGQAYRLRAIEEIKDHMPFLVRARNFDGMTPLESVLMGLNMQRSSNEVLDPYRSPECKSPFVEYDESARKALYLLADVETWDFTETSNALLDKAISATEEDDKFDYRLPIIRRNLELKYGCTCGKCAGGFLSPRMRMTLHIVTREIFNRLRGPRQNEDPMMLEPNYYGLDTQYLSKMLITQLKFSPNHLMRICFEQMFNLFADCFYKKRVPNERTIMAVAKHNTFLQQGGTVAQIGNIIFRETYIADPLFGIRRKEAQYITTWERQYQGLPECYNDTEYAFAAAACGYTMLRDDPVSEEELNGEYQSSPFYMPLEGGTS